MNSFHFSAFLAVALPLFACVEKAVSEVPGYANDFQTTEVGKAPKDFLVIAGAFAVREEGGKKFLELPGSPLDTFGALFGPAKMEGLSVTGKFFGTKTGRKFPAFGLSLNGAGGYRLQVSAAKKQIEIFKGDESRANAPFEWSDAVWFSLRIQARQTPTGAWVIEGKVWPAGEGEPATWTVSLEEKDAPAAGRPGVWGSPFSGTPIRFDDLAVTPIR